MSTSIRSTNIEKRNLDNGRCQILNNDGIVLAEFNGTIVEMYSQLFVVEKGKLFDIAHGKFKRYELKEHIGEIDII